MNEHDRWHALLDVASAARRRSDHAAARAALEQVRQGAQGEALCQAHVGLGRLASDEGRPREGLDWLRRALAEAELLTPRHRTAALGAAAMAACDCGEFEEARRYEAQRLELATLSGSREEEAHTQHDLGRIALESGNAAAAVDHFSNALDIFSHIGLRTGQCRACHQLGTAWEELQELPKAYRCFEKALELAEAVGDVEQQIASLMHLSIGAQHQEALDAAKAFALRGLALAEESRHVVGITKISHELINICMARGERQEARKWAEQVLFRTEYTTQLTLSVAARYSLGVIELQEGRWVEGIEWLHSAVVAGHRSSTDALSRQMRDLAQATVAQELRRREASDPRVEELSDYLLKGRG